MPGFITHYICGQAVLNAAPPELQAIIKPYRQFYNIGTQGPDIFFYYLPGLLKRRLRDIGTKMHKAHFGTFISSMIDIMEDADDAVEKPLLTAYICGFLTHYVLDATAHPYVYSKTGVRKKGDIARAIRFSVNHRKLETAIDILMLDLLSSKKPADYKLWQLIQVDRGLAQTVSGAVSHSVGEAHGRYVSAKEVCNAMTYMVHITRLLQSRTGRRKKFMELIENLTIGENLVTSLIHMQEVNDGVDYMNMAHNPWGVPGTEEQTDSFVELYQKAVQDGIVMLGTLWACMKGEVSRDKLAVTLGDRSLSTGFAPDPSIILG